MSVIKETMKEIITLQPDDSSYDEILRELVFDRMVQRGLANSDAGHTVSDEEIKRKIDSWRK
ncbi:MAG: hypothetical protein WCJ35_26925 [Planctomycetota bacterium]